MPVIRTVLLILALVLSWIALRAESAAHPAAFVIQGPTNEGPGVPFKTR